MVFLGSGPYASKRVFWPFGFTFSEIQNSKIENIIFLNGGREKNYVAVDTS
jgi:hypothetical protein